MLTIIATVALSLTLVSTTAWADDWPLASLHHTV